MAARAWTQTAFERAVVALKLDDNATAAERLRVLARLGHSDAQYHLGMMYAFGWGVPKNDEVAIRWFSRARLWPDGASEAAAPAEYYVGKRLEEGLGVPKDLAEARKWYERAATGGYPKAKQWLESHTANAPVPKGP